MRFTIDGLAPGPGDLQRRIVRNNFFGRLDVAWAVTLQWHWHCVPASRGAQQGLFLLLVLSVSGTLLCLLCFHIFVVTILVTGIGDQVMSWLCYPLDPDFWALTEVDRREEGTQGKADMHGPVLIF